MRIGELARRSGVSVRMLRYYEQQGLLRPQRSASGYRQYTEAEASVVKRIRSLTEAGLRLSTIRVVLPCTSEQDGRLQPCQQVRPALERELARISAKIDALEESRRILTEHLQGLGG